MTRSLSAFLFLLLASVGMAQMPYFQGRIDGDVYTSATGAFAVPIPVLPALGGTVTDTSNVVVFDDAVSTHISIATFPLDANQRWELSNRGLKNYLGFYFKTRVLPDFLQLSPTAAADPQAVFLPHLLDGSLLVYLLLPGGSMFARKVPVIDPERPPPVAKRGNLLFVKNGFIYVISMELGERVTEGSAYTLTPAQENDLLHDRLIRFAQTLRFLSPAP